MLAPLGLMAIVACGPSYDDCHAHRTCPAPMGGRAGANEDMGGAGGGAGDLEQGGSGGDTTTAPVENGQCSKEAESICATNADSSVLTCSDGKWVRQPCAEDERCNSMAPGCHAIAEGCEDREPGEAFCALDVRHVCGPDLVTREDERCGGLCLDAVCLPPSCGDGIVQEDEACDDGNTDDSDECVECQGARCGDGFVQVDAEECDDGNASNDDDCVRDCVSARCGDGLLNVAEEECDRGALDSDTGECTTSCKAAACGDGAVWKGKEACDDGNDDATDGCRSCELTPMKLAAGNGFTCAIFGDGSMKCWGANSAGQLGIGDETNRGDKPGQLGKALPALSFKKAVSDVALGLQHSCAISDGVVYCWGSGNWGELGQGNMLRKDLPVAVDVGGARAAGLALGQGFSCALLEDGSVKCWGRGERGALGTGDDVQIGDGIGEMGAKLRPVTLPSTSRVMRISAHRHGICALLDSQGVACWGDGALLPAAPAVRLGPADDLAIGSYHRCILDYQGRVECWGQGGLGQLGYENALDRDNEANFIATVPLPGQGMAESISVGDNFTCAVIEGKAYCWGEAGPQLGQPAYSDEGYNLGDDANEISKKMTAIDLGPEATVHALAVGFYHVCALLTSGDVKCWGHNEEGQLGLGDTDARGGELSDMGASLPALKF